MTRRRNLAALIALGCGAATGVLAAPNRALREMQVYKLPELKLKIWIENQPPWTTQVQQQNGHATFIAESPENYHPPTVMTFTSWPDARTADDKLYGLASAAIRRASQNFGLTIGQARGLQVVGAEYGLLRGYQSIFEGSSEGTAMDVVVFVGQAPGRFPVVLCLYTQRGKIGNLTEHRRRSWGKLKYL
jgi:hypothetical protein